MMDNQQVQLKTTTSGFKRDNRRESLKASIKVKQAQLLTYSSMGVEMVRNNQSSVNHSSSKKFSVNMRDQRALPAINVEQVSTEKTPSWKRKAKSNRGVFQEGRLSVQTKGRNFLYANPAKQAPSGGHQSLLKSGYPGSQSQRNIEVDGMNRRKSQPHEKKTYRSQSKLGMSSKGKLLTKQTAPESIQSLVQRNPSLRILQINDASSNSSDEEIDKKKPPNALDRSYKASRKVVKQKEQVQMVEDKKKVVEVRDLLTKSVYPEGERARSQYKKQQKEVERQFQSIYYINQLQSNQLPLPKVSSSDFLYLQSSLNGGQGIRPRLDSMKLTIKQQVYKGNKQISSRGQNLINLVSPLRQKAQRTPRPVTANAAQPSDSDAREERQKSESTPLSQKKSEDVALQQTNPKPGQGLDDSEEIYRNERFETHQEQDAKSYIKKVLLEDIVFHKLTGEEEKIYGMQRCQNSDQSKMVEMLSKNANRQHKGGPTSARDTSGIMSKSYDQTSRPESRPGHIYTNNNSRIINTPADRSFVEGKSVGQYCQRKKSIFNDGSSVNEFLPEGTGLQNQMAEFDQYSAGYGKVLRGISQKSERRPNNKVERNSSARLYKPSMAAATNSQGRKSRASIRMGPVQQAQSSLQVSRLEDVNENDQAEKTFHDGNVTISKNDGSGQNPNTKSQYFASISQGSLEHQGTAQLGSNNTPAKTERYRGNSSTSGNVSGHDNEQMEAKQDGTAALNEEQIEVIRRILVPANSKSQDDVDYLYNYFNNFDFMQASKKDKEAKKKFGQAQTQRQQQKQAQEMAKDQKSIEQMCRVTKHLFIEKGQTVFEYDSLGDLFYMMISGRVICKIPFSKQMIQLSPVEKQLFQIHYKEDLLGIQEATDINKHLELEKQNQETMDTARSGKRKANSKNAIDFSKLQYFKNPYDLDPKKLQRYSRDVLAKVHLEIANQKRQELAKQALESQLRKENQNENDSTLSNQQQDQMEGNNESSVLSSTDEKKDATEQERLMKDPLYLASIDPEYVQLKQAFQSLLEDPESQAQRKYYQINIMKVVKTYQEYGSFGELALITKKRRKAKLETQSDTHFAILSKEDYLQAQYKAQNQRLKEKLLFLKNFDLFQMLTESQLSVLSYHMKEELFYRGQVVYKEGIDMVDKIYLVRHGDFLLTKQLIRKADMYSAADVLHEGLNKMEQKETASSNEDAQSKDKGDQSLFSYHQFRNLQSFRSFALNSRTSSTNEIQICILSDRDAFGYQELLERDVEYRSCTVRCLKNESQVVTIDKNSLISIVRSNPRVLDSMKQKWTQFLVDRVSNKLFVEQLIKKNNGQVYSEADQHEKHDQDKVLQNLKKTLQDPENEKNPLKDPNKTVEIKMNPEDQNNPLGLNPYGSQIDHSSNPETAQFKGTANLQMSRSSVSFRYKSKVGQGIINRPHDEHILREYVDNSQEKFVLAPGQEMQTRSRSDKRFNVSNKKTTTKLEQSFDQLEKKWLKQRSIDPSNQQIVYLTHNQGLKQQVQPLTARQSQQKQPPGGLSHESHMSENQRLGSRTSPVRQPIFYRPQGENSEDPNIIRSVSEMQIVKESSEASKVNNILQSNRGSLQKDGAAVTGLVDLTFHRTSHNYPHYISTPATVEDLIQFDKSRQSNNMDVAAGLGGAFAPKQSSRYENEFKLDTTPLSTDRETQFMLQHSKSQQNQVTTSQLGLPSSIHGPYANQHMSQQSGVEQTSVIHSNVQQISSRNQTPKEFANWTNTTNKGAKHKALLTAQTQSQSQQPSMTTEDSQNQGRKSASVFTTKDDQSKK